MQDWRREMAKHTAWPDLRANLFLLCMVPLLCSAKETKSVSKQPDKCFDYEDFVELRNLPTHAVNADISVEYMCTKPCTIHVDIMASSEFRTGIIVFKKQWKNEKILHELRTRTVNLIFPNIMVYRSDYFQKLSIDVYYTVVRAWLVHIDPKHTDRKYNETVLSAVANAFAVLEPISPVQRPYKDHQICLTWYAELMWRRREIRFPICPFETDAVRMLNFPLASSTEHNGVILIQDRFKNRELELRRQQLVNNNPIFTFSLWLYLLDFCTSKECGIFHNVDSNKMYATPLLFLTQKGKVHVQVRLVTGADVAILTNFQVPLYKWFRLDLTINGRKIVLTTHVGEHLESHGYQSYNVEEDIYFDDTDGYIVLGGSKYVLGIDGFFGPVQYYRMRALNTEEIFNPLGKDEIYQWIDKYYLRCATVQEIVYTYTNIVRETQELQTEGTSTNYYVDLYFKYGRKLVCPGLPWNQEERNQFRNILNFLKTINSPSSDHPNAILVETGKKIYDDAMEKQSHHLRHFGSVVPALEDASCLGFHKASYRLAVMYEIGLGVAIDPVQGLLYSLVGAQNCDRLALLKLGYNHFQGVDNYPLDFGLSYAYYISIAKKTPKDRWTMHEEQAFVEAVRLMDDEMLKEQTRENDDLFLWLKQNAERGDVHAQHRLAQMFYWGQQGVSKNKDAAMEWYERGALENKDPVIMYDYAILLLKGDGVPKNKKLALKLMKRAAAKGQHEAFNGLGWYYHTFKKDYGKAAAYWRKAFNKGNVDSAFNLGVMHLNGIYPGDEGINETRAFELITIAAEGGHIEGAIHLAQYLISGSLKGVPRDPQAAIGWAKHVAEQNGHIGHAIRKALNAYMDGCLNEAFLYYTLAAEAGIEVAQTNLAYLCEESSKATTIFPRDTCIWRYYNFSIYQNNPPPVALLKMGDLYYSGSSNRSKDIQQSVTLYTQAALQGDAQGYFNLAQLVQEGVSIPENLLQHLKIDKSVYSNNDSLMTELYERCQGHSNDESINPCSLVLLYLHVTGTWKSMLYSFMAYLMGSLLLSIVVTIVVQCIHLILDISSSNNHLANGEQTGPSVSGTRHLQTGVHSWYMYRLIVTVKQIVRRQREAIEWLTTALVVSICIFFVTFVIWSV
ncbi:protein sel-1 homolog 3 [Spea bombifrons]|uniref:protein sel-1 homolog 3 n=1 Tax=Spea bombifrons TaxID=233779 RepID=UPI00234A5FBF|nr:protein sel-1 homolog 3 [Spea bombifrons]